MSENQVLGTSDSPSAEPTKPVTSNQLLAKAKPSASSKWLVAYTKPRWEKKLADQLTQKGFTVYCPTQRVKRRWSDRTKWIDQPLFSSHIFIHMEPERRDAIYFTPGFVRFLFWNKQPAQVRETEIDTLKRWLNDFDHEAITVEVIAPGTKVHVQSGPLQGREGIVLEQRGTKLELLLEDLQVKISVDLSKTEVLR